MKVINRDSDNSKVLTRSKYIWLCRVCFAVVFVLNVTCAFQFIVLPEAYMGAYQLEGVSGRAAIQGIGVAFLMWNATYPAFIVNPNQFKVLGIVICVQQAIGAVGETMIMFSLPASGFELLTSSIIRFLAFDVVGLIAMTMCTCLLFLARKNSV